MGLIGIFIFICDVRELFVSAVAQLIQGSLKPGDPAKQLGCNTHILSELAFQAPFRNLQLAPQVVKGCNTFGLCDPGQEILYGLVLVFIVLAEQGGKIGGKNLDPVGMGVFIHHLFGEQAALFSRQGLQAGAGIGELIGVQSENSPERIRIEADTHGVEAAGKADHAIPGGLSI